MKKKSSLISQIPALLFVIILGIVLFQCSETKKEKEPRFQRAEQIFTTVCSGCHGGQMQAFVDREWKFGNSKTELLNTIANGIDTLGMPSFAAAYTEDELKELVNYIRDGINNVDQYKFQEVELKSDTFQSDGFSYHLDTVLTGGNSYWGMAFLPKGEMLVTEKSGTIYRVDEIGTSVEVTPKIAVQDKGQGGLLDIEVHPDFSNNHWVYYSYSAIKEIEGKLLSTTAVDRAELDRNELKNVTRIFEALPYSHKKYHYGSRMEFDKDGYLFVSVGDRASRDVNPQSLANHCGKIHRIYDDGTIPQDNPFVNQDGAIASIYSYGHRNPQGMGLNPSSGYIWTHEHGPRGGDELNVIQSKINYGWPVISYGINYDGTVFTSLLEKEGLQQPMHYWVPSIAPCGMAFVNSDRYPGWKNQLLIGSLRFKYLNLCYIDGNKVLKEERLMENIGRVRNVKVSPDGYIYIATEEKNIEGKASIYRLIPIKE
ncbi:MAG: PQQ-dependent sugar dehydrogenase [Cyclobacteriaceae bacterium]